MTSFARVEWPEPSPLTPYKMCAMGDAWSISRRRFFAPDQAVASNPNVQDFEILFDYGEASPMDDAAYQPYGKLGFPPAPAERPWICSNFVQSLDGMASFKGRHATGGDISQSPEDRWL